jgi:hypothetical protein
MLVSGVEADAKRIALVIGNAAYRHVAPLVNTTNDSDQIARMLKAAGFEVLHHRDLTLAAFRLAVSDLADRSQNADYALVFFAGHGIEVDGVNYFVPVDAKLASDFDVPDDTISLDRILSAIGPARQLRMVILDACRNNPFLPKMRRTSATRSVGRGLARVEPAVSNTLVAFAAKAGSTAEDGDGPNSPYTSALLKYMAIPGLDLRIAMGRVRDEVLAVTRNKQEPFIYGSLGGSLIALSDSEPSSTPPNASMAAPDEEAGRRRDFELATRVDNADALRSYIKRYPEGFYTDLARAQLARLSEPRSADPTAPEKERAAIPADIAGRLFTISGTEVRDIAIGSFGAPRVQRQITIKFDQAGAFKTSNRTILPDGRESIVGGNQGQLNEPGPRGGWTVQNGRLVGQLVTEGFHWRGTIEPSVGGCTATMTYEPPPGQKLMRLTNRNTGQSFQAKSIRFERITCKSQ